MIHKDFTLLIPLHLGHRWSNVVLSSIDKFIDVCKIIVSDCDESDTLLSEISKKYQGHKNFEVLGKRKLDKGWVAHWNDLLLRVDTKYFMWLSQDDEIDIDWLSVNLNILKENELLAGSFGKIHRIKEGGAIETFNLANMNTHPISNFNIEVHELIKVWNFGIATRAIWDKSKVKPILKTQEPNDEWADIVWIYGTLLEHPIMENSRSVYRKRWYQGSAHSSWRPFTIYSALPFLKREIERRSLSDSVVVELLELCKDALTQERDQLTQERDQLTQERDQLTHERDQLTQERDQLTQERDQLNLNLREVLDSNTWKSLEWYRRIRRFISNR